jgi:flagellum-specific ATP synthase
MKLKQKIENNLNVLNNIDTYKVNGRVVQVIGMLVESIGPSASIGEICSIRSKYGEEICVAEVVGFRENYVLSMLLGDVSKISPGSEIVASGRSFMIGVGPNVLGRVIDGLGQPLDNKGPIQTEKYVSIYNEAPHPLNRNRITEPIATGIRSIDSFLTMGKGQRMGIFAGSGVGKSVMLGMVARNTSADINVISLVGERGREVRDFIERDLGTEGLKRSVVVVATGDQPALIRIKSTLIATSIAEYFRNQGADVMLMMDSITRVAMAQREIGLAIGEPPTTKGYTPSVFSLLPKLLERAGNNDKGSITGLYAVLVDGDDMNEPIADAARSILDGHIVLSRKLASSGHYPAVDVLQSVSRVMSDVTDSEYRKLTYQFIDLLAIYAESEDLINIGAYVKGSNPKIDKAISLIEPMKGFLKQGVDEKVKIEENISRLSSLLNT